MKIFIKITFVLTFFLFSTDSYSFEITGDKVNLSGKITSITLKAVSYTHLTLPTKA